MTPALELALTPHRRCGSLDLAVGGQRAATCPKGACHSVPRADRSRQAYLSFPSTMSASLPFRPQEDPDPDAREDGDNDEDEEDVDETVRAEDHAILHN